MKQNVNHKSFYEDAERVETPIEVIEEKPVEVIVEEVDAPLDEEFFFSLTKKEQIAILYEHGLNKKEIKSLRLEQDRVNMLIKFNCL